MDKIIATGLLVEKIREYATDRAANVAKGKETPWLAALLMQKYGHGFVDAVTVIYDSPRAADMVLVAFKHETTRLDADWCGLPGDIVARA